MSLPNNINKDWERRKQYLVRSLFEDAPSEDRELKDISKSPLSRSPRLVSPLRPESPLPPLIIEAMPDKHDDPPEYYEELKKKMIKVYRKMFLDERSSSPESDKNYDTCSLDTDRISQGDSAVSAVQAEPAARVRPALPYDGGSSPSYI